MENATEVPNEPKLETSKGEIADQFEGAQVDETVDVSGLNCPVLGLTQLHALGQIEPGEILEVKSREGRVQSIVDWVVKHSGSELLETIEHDGLHRFLIRKGRPVGPGNER